jgi:pimeloyl-[acyl-carrier protein] methyl ester esterase
VFEDFTRALADDPPAALRRFIALQAHGDAAARTIIRELRRQCCAMPPPVALGAGLNLLRETDLRVQLDSIGQPTLIMHGAHDAVTPPAAGAWLAQTLSNVRSTLMPGAAHAPFLSAPRAFVERVVEFCNER